MMSIPFTVKLKAYILGITKYKSYCVYFPSNILKFIIDFINFILIVFLGIFLVSYKIYELLNSLNFKISLLEADILSFALLLFFNFIYIKYSKVEVQTIEECKDRLLTNKIGKYFFYGFTIILVYVFLKVLLFD